MEIWEGISRSVIIGVLDILLVSFLIYQILILVKGTRAQPMLLGMGMIVAVYLFSDRFGLVTLNWLLGTFLGSVILVVVVLFQDDFRRALFKMGLVPGLGTSGLQLVERSIAEISKTASVLASRRIGALIVIARNVGLDDFVEGAIQLDALVSHQMLVSIFHPTSPLHDGAVIIEKDRILAAGSVLPLSFNPAASERFGTRHRAAIGLSERTDALIVVVSEEEGIISLVRDGRINRNLNEKSLSNALTRLVRVRRQKKERMLKRAASRKDALIEKRTEQDPSSKVSESS